MNTWEEIGNHTSRIKIPKGWLVRSWQDGEGVSGSSGAHCALIIVEDEKHEWTI